jgi:hypothetical protein
MATYVLPQVLVFQEFEQNAEVDQQPLNAFVFGGHAFLLRYSDTDEKVLSSLGMYDHVGALVDGDYKTCYSWPERPAGADIDTTYTKLYIDNALLRYFHDTSNTATKEAANKIRLPSHALIDNPAEPDTYPRNAAFYDRDAEIGDAVKIVGDDGLGGDPETLYTYIRGFEADEVAATIDATPTADAANEVTQILSTTDTPDPDNSGDATIDSVDATSYDGHPDGDLDEVYTIEVIQASTGSDATTGRLRVTSASGRDDDASVTPAAFGSPTAIGARGATVTWDALSTEFTLGDIWTVEVHQAFTAPTTAAAGTYTGDTDRTYIVEVTSGGLFAASPTITVTTTDGTDFSGPTIVTASATAVAVGTKGVTIAFTGTALSLGDRYYIETTAATDGSYKTLVLGHNIQADIDDNFEVSLYIKKDIEVGEQHVAVDGQYNWEQSDTEFCAFAGIQAYDDSYTDEGEPVALDVITEEDWDDTNEMYLEYRAWRNDLADTVRAIDDVADLDDAISGDLTPDNPLKWGVYKALQNSNGQEVKYMAVEDPDNGTTGWISVLDEIEERTDVYGLVPLTRDATVLGLIQAHVDAQSTETAGRWRVAWFNLEIDSVIVIASDANSVDSGVILATTEDDPDTSGTQYTLLKVPDNNGLFVTNGVVAGDIVRYQYTTDMFGEITYSEYVIDEVVNESTLLLQTGTTVAESTPRKVEVWRNLSVQEQAEEIASTAGNWANRRIRAIWPDEFEGDGVTQEGYFLCCCLAGLVSGVVPQQGLTNLEIAGVTGVPRTTELFNRSQLDEMAVNGTWIVTQDPRSGEVYSRHALSTADYENIDFREEMVTRNVDSISYYLQDTFAPYIGISNVTPSMLDIIEAETNAAIQFLRAANFTPRLGGQLIEAAITDLRISPVFKDRIILSLDLTIPYSLNNLEVHLLI